MVLAALLDQGNCFYLLHVCFSGERHHIELQLVTTWC